MEIVVAIAKVPKDGDIIWHSVDRDDFVDKYDCPHCPRRGTVYRTEQMGFCRCSVCNKRTTWAKVIDLMYTRYNIAVHLID